MYDEAIEKYTPVYSDRINAHITQEDHNWLSSFGVDDNCLNNGDFIEEINSYILEGSQKLGNPGNEELYQSIILARYKFFDFIGIGDEVLDIFKKSNPTLIPLDTFISTQRVLESHNINGSKIIQTSPFIIGLAPESVEIKINNLRNLGIDACKAINSSPVTLSLAPEYIEAKIDTLNNLGIDAVKTVNSFPNSLGLATESINVKVENLNALGLNATKVINSCPAVLGYAPESIRTKIDNLNDLGIDVVKTVNSFPAVLGYAPESIRTKIENLREIGLDNIKVINMAPMVLGLTTESIKTKISNLKEFGLDGTKIVNYTPTILALATESIRAKIDNLNDLGIDAIKAINKFPTTLGYAQESVRLKYYNLINLGINATRVINSSPMVLGLATESVNSKFRILDRTARLLKWEYSAQDLIEDFPMILGYNSKKIAILRRIMATHITDEENQIKPARLKSPLITPLEKYIIALHQTENNEKYTLRELSKLSERIKLPAQERREKALSITSDKQNLSLGRIGLMYLDYRNIPPK